MIRGPALPVAETAELTNRKKYRVMRAVASRTTIFLTGETTNLGGRIYE